MPKRASDFSEAIQRTTILINQNNWRCTWHCYDACVYFNTGKNNKTLKGIDRILSQFVLNMMTAAVDDNRTYVKIAFFAVFMHFLYGTFFSRSQLRFFVSHSSPELSIGKINKVGEIEVIFIFLFEKWMLVCS